MFVQEKEEEAMKSRYRIGLLVTMFVLWALLFTYMGALLHTLKSASRSSQHVAISQRVDAVLIAQEEPPPEGGDSGTVSPDEVG